MVRGWRSIKGKWHYVIALFFPFLKCQRLRRDTVSKAAPWPRSSQPQLPCKACQNCPGAWPLPPLLLGCCRWDPVGRFARCSLGGGYSWVTEWAGSALGGAWGTSLALCHLALLASHRVTAWLMLEETSGGHLVQPPWSSSPSHSGKSELMYCPSTNPSGCWQQLTYFASKHIIINSISNIFSHLCSHFFHHLTLLKAAAAAGAD